MNGASHLEGLASLDETTSGDSAWGTTGTGIMAITTSDIPSRIFISYRREEAAYPAGWLFDLLASRFGAHEVFKDVDSIQPGDNFVEVITAAVGSCDVLLVLIGSQWLTVTDEKGRRRLDNPGDFVRLEIEAALTRDLRVIPVLVEGAKMPRADQLPASLAKLVRRQALELSPDRFDSDARRLLRVLDTTITEATQARQQVPQRTAQPTMTRPASAATPVLDTSPGQYSRLSLGMVTTQRPEAVDVPQLARTGHVSWASGVVAFSPDGLLLAWGCKDNTVGLWDPATGTQQRILTGHTGGVSGVAFSPDGQLLASSGEDKTVRLWDPATGTQQRVLTGHTGGVYGVAFSPDGQLLASIGEVKTVRLWDPATGTQQRVLTGHTGIHAVFGVAFSPDGRLLASCGGDKTVRLWDPATGTQQRVLTGHTGIPGVTSQTFGVAFSPDGQLLASCGGDKTVRLWDPATGEQLHILTGHTRAVFGVAFSPDGRLLASCGGDKTVRLWDPATGEQLHILTGHTGGVYGVAFSPDGQLLASSGTDKMMWQRPPS